MRSIMFLSIRNRQQMQTIDTIKEDKEMVKRFEIIKNSESHTGYQIPDKEFKGMKDGLCCGWQYEIKDAEGNYHYTSVSWEEVTPEEYANKWQTDDGRSWLLDMYPAGCDFTGRVIFRGYAESYYDSDERDWYVVEVDEKEVV